MRALSQFFHGTALLGGLMLAAPIMGQESNNGDPPTSQTGASVDVSIESLEILVKPLTKAELETEVQVWLERLHSKAAEISQARLASLGQSSGASDSPPDGETGADTTEADPVDETSGTASAYAAMPKEQLAETIGRLQTELTAIAERLEVALVSLEAKGGEVEAARQYITAVSGIEINASDANIMWVVIRTWLTSTEGGVRWAWNLSRFLLILIITYIAARILSGVTNWLMESKLKMSQLAENLISRSVKNVILLVGLAISLTALEVDITPILASIGAAGLVVGLALQGTLSNFASGLLILLNRPFDEGDTVNAGGVTGKVNKMNLVSTTFRTFDNQTIHVPNNEIWGNVITNITANKERRVDLEFGIGYDDDFEQAESIIRETVLAHELVLADPEPVVVTHELGDSCVMIVCRPWAKTEDWWTVKTDLTRQVKKRFDEVGISIPYPQRDIHVYQHSDG